MASQLQQISQRLEQALSTLAIGSENLNRKLARMEGRLDQLDNVAGTGAQRGFGTGAFTEKGELRVEIDSSNADDIAGQVAGSITGAIAGVAASPVAPFLALGGLIQSGLGDDAVNLAARFTSATINKLQDELPNIATAFADGLLTELRKGLPAWMQNFQEGPRAGGDPSDDPNFQPNTTPVIDIPKAIQDNIINNPQSPGSGIPVDMGGGQSRNDPIMDDAFLYASGGVSDMDPLLISGGQADFTLEPERELPPEKPRESIIGNLKKRAEERARQMKEGVIDANEAMRQHLGDVVDSAREFKEDMMSSQLGLRVGENLFGPSPHLTDTEKEYAIMKHYDKFASRGTKQRAALEMRMGMLYENFENRHERGFEDQFPHLTPAQELRFAQNLQRRFETDWRYNENLPGPPGGIDFAKPPHARDYERFLVGENVEADLRDQLLEYQEEYGDFPEQFYVVPRDGFSDGRPIYPADMEQFYKDLNIPGLPEYEKERIFEYGPGFKRKQGIQGMLREGILNFGSAVLGAGSVGLGGLNFLFGSQTANAMGRGSVAERAFGVLPELIEQRALDRMTGGQGLSGFIEQTFGENRASYIEEGSGYLTGSDVSNRMGTHGDDPAFDLTQDFAEEIAGSRERFIVGVTEQQRRDHVNSVLGIRDHRTLARLYRDKKRWSVGDDFAIHDFDVEENLSLSEGGIWLMSNLYDDSKLSKSLLRRREQYNLGYYATRNFYEGNASTADVNRMRRFFGEELPGLSGSRTLYSGIFGYQKPQIVSAGIGDEIINPNLQFMSFDPRRSLFYSNIYGTSETGYSAGSGFDLRGNRRDSHYTLAEWHIPEGSKILVPNQYKAVREAIAAPNSLWTKEGEIRLDNFGGLDNLNLIRMRYEGQAKAVAGLGVVGGAAMLGLGGESAYAAETLEDQVRRHLWGDIEQETSPYSQPGVDAMMPADLITPEMIFRRGDAMMPAGLITPEMIGKRVLQGDLQENSQFAQWFQKAEQKIDQWLENSQHGINRGVGTLARFSPGTAAGFYNEIQDLEGYAEALGNIFPKLEKYTEPGGRLLKGARGKLGRGIVELPWVQQIREEAIIAEKAIDGLSEASSTLAREFTGAMADAALGTEKWKTTLEDIPALIQDIIIEMAVLRPTANFLSDLTSSAFGRAAGQGVKSAPIKVTQTINDQDTETSRNYTDAKIGIYDDNRRKNFNRVTSVDYRGR